MANVRAGDTAVVISGRASGAIVKVLREFGEGELSPQGHHVRTYGLLTWLVESLGSPLKTGIYRKGASTPHRFEHLPVRPITDRRLRRLFYTEGEDEMLALAPPLPTTKKEN